MKRFVILTGVMTGLCLYTSAQTALPYATNFDNTSQKAGWQFLRKGFATAHPWSYLTDAPDGAIVPPTAPDCLFHQYPMDGTATQLTNDWAVSPPLNLSTGAKVTFKINVYSISGLQPGDSVQLLLLKGSADPATATGKVLLANLTQMQSSSNHNFKDTADIAVPAVTGNAYLAFHYTSYQNWFTAAVDNFSVKALTTGITGAKATAADWKLYPNPVSQTLYWEYKGAGALQESTGQIVDITGKVQAQFSMKEQQADLGRLLPGLYFLKNGATTLPFLKQ